MGKCTPSCHHAAQPFKRRAALLRKRPWATIAAVNERERETERKSERAEGGGRRGCRGRWKEGAQREVEGGGAEGGGRRGCGRRGCRGRDVEKVVWRERETGIGREEMKRRSGTEGEITSLPSSRRTQESAKERADYEKI